MADAKVNMQKYLNVILRVKAPKDEQARNYAYRDIERIYEAIKPILEIEKAVIVPMDEAVQEVGNRFYVVSTLGFVDAETGDVLAKAKGWAREPEKMPGQAEPQVTGTASTYAKKRALQSLLMLDNSSDDPDRMGNRPASNPVAQSQPTRPTQPTKQVPAQSGKKVLLWGKLNNAKINPDAFARSGGLSSFDELNENDAANVLNSFDSAVANYKGWKNAQSQVQSEDVPF